MTIPVKKDTAPLWMQSMADKYLYTSREFTAHLDGRACETCPGDDCCCGAPAEWLREAALEAYTAFTETLDTWVETLIQGRPYDTPLVEWEHRDLDKSDVEGMLAEMGQARREMAAEVAACPLCGKPSDDGSVHQDCADYEAMYADRIPAEDAPEAAASQESW